jgi:phosphoribosylformylglycinamidine synthase
MEVELEKIPTHCAREDYTLYSESQGRLIVTVNPEDREKFERAIGQNIFAMIGRVRGDNKFLLRKNGKKVVDTTVNKLTELYKSTFRNY